MLNPHLKVRTASAMAKALSTPKSGIVSRPYLTSHRQDITNLKTECARILRTLKLADAAWEHNWDVTFEKFKKQFDEQLESAYLSMRRVHNIRQALVTNNNQPYISPAVIYQDLTTLDKTFESVEIDLKERKILATTPDIIMESIHFGKFIIEYCWKGIEGETFDFSPDTMLRVIPVSPRYNLFQEFFHPHIGSAGTICTGNTHTPIISAAKEGRIFDIFEIVHTLLRSYNSMSPFAKLHTWIRDYREGIPTIGTLPAGKTLDDFEEELEEYGADAIIDTSPQSAMTCGRCAKTTLVPSQCEHCRYFYCEACIVECASCAEMYCKGCSREYVNPVNSLEIKWGCTNCRRSCPECGRNTNLYFMEADLGVCLVCAPRIREIHNRINGAVNEQTSRTQETTEGTEPEGIRDVSDWIIDDDFEEDEESDNSEDDDVFDD